MSWWRPADSRFWHWGLSPSRKFKDEYPQATGCITTADPGNNFLISGRDTLVPIKPTEKIKALIVKHFKRTWPNMFVEHVDGCDLFVYQDKATHKAWLEDGGTRSNQDTMIYVIHRKDAITFVDGGKNTARMVDELVSILSK